MDRDDPRVMRDSLRACVPDGAVKLCGMMWRGGRKKVQIRVGEDEEAKRRAWIMVPALCRSRHACPVCTPEIRDIEAARLRRAVAEAGRQGHEVFMLTLTVRHSREDRLEPLLALLNNAWRYLSRGTEWRRLRKECGIQGFVRALDVCHGRRAGWHPHFHVLLVTKGGSGLATDEARAATAGRFHDAWIRALKHTFIDMNVEIGQWLSRLPLVDHGVSLVPTTGSGDYIVKGTAIPTVADERGGSRTVWNIMRGAADGDTADQDLWFEYTEAIKFRQLLPGLDQLEKSLRLTAKTSPDRSTTELVAEVPPAIYNDLAARPGAISRVERGAVESGLDGVAVAVVRELHADLQEGSDQFWHRVRELTAILRPSVEPASAVPMATAPPPGVPPAGSTGVIPARDPSPFGRGVAPAHAASPGDRQLDRFRQIVLLRYQRHCAGRVRAAAVTRSASANARCA